jgi:hypothetical protein
MLTLKKYLQNLGIEPSDELIAKLTAADAEDDDTVQDLLSKSQTYARPFLESEFSEKMSDERKSMKGKYFKEMVQKFNKQFGNLLTSGEIDKILSNPENQGQTFDAVIASIHAKAIEQLSPKESAELRQMLDAANAEKNTLKEQLEAKDSEYEQRLNARISEIETDRTLDSELSRAVSAITSLNPTAAAKLIRSELKARAVIKAGNDGRLSLYDIKNPETPLKKSGTELYTFDALVADIARENELPAKKSAGNEKVITQSQQEPKQMGAAAKSAASLAEVMAGVTAD